MQIVISAPLPTHFHEGSSQLQEISSQKQGDRARWALGMVGSGLWGLYTHYIPAQ